MQKVLTTRNKEDLVCVDADFALEVVCQRHVLQSLDGIIAKAYFPLAARQADAPSALLHNAFKLRVRVQRNVP